MVIKLNSRCRSLVHHSNSAELQKLYLLANYHGRGIAQELVSKGLQSAAEAGARSIWLSVFSGNQRAKRFYAKHGFAVVGSSSFQMGRELHKDDVMLAELA